jgi:F-box interacting protein
MKTFGRILEFGYYSILLYSIFNFIVNKEKKNSTEEASSAIFPDELMVEIVSWLPVKYVMQLRCVNKFFNTLIFDPHFIQMHLNKSAQNLQLALICFKSESRDDPEDSDDPKDWSHSMITLSIPCLLQNIFTIFHHSDPYYLLSEYPHVFRWVVGSCNGLLCLFGASCSCPSDQWLYIWNPAMRKESKKLALFFDMHSNPNFNFSFGYDNSTQTYKVVAFYVEVKPGRNPKSVVKVFSLGDNSWRDIQCLPVLPLYCLLDINNNKNDGVHLNGTINWFAFHDGININIKSIVPVDQCVILSLDLSTETYAKLLLPRRFDKVSTRYLPKLVVLMDCLCFCHDFENTHFVIWQMKNFGVEDSWIQLFKISYEHFYTWMDPLPLYLSENGDTLVLANVKRKETFIYNCRDNKVEKIGIAKHIKWSQTKGYIESLVSTH